MPSDGESFGWVDTDTEQQSSSNSDNKETPKKMVKQEKVSSDDDGQQEAPLIISPLPGVVKKREKLSPAKSPISNINPKTTNINGLNTNVNVQQNVTKLFSARSNGNVSDFTRRNKILLDNYIQNNEHLLKNTRISSHEITDDDEIFLLQCPPSIDIDLLLGLDFLDREKKKFKLGKTSFESVLSNNKRNCKVTVLTPQKNNEQYKLQTFNVQGSYLIKEKIKSLNEIEVIVEEEMPVPFPMNLKERHPLFGASYKQLLKIPQSVKEKFLNPVPKLPKVKKIKVESINEEVVESVVVKSKKSKKRKADCLDESEDHYEPKKKIKKEKDMWTTETSIEANLFNVSAKSKKKSKQSL